MWRYAIAGIIGLAAGVAVSKNSKRIREACTTAIGGVLDIKDKTVEAVECAKESAEDLIAEADAKRKSQEV